MHSAAHCSISPPVFLSSDRISAAYLLFRFPSQLKYLVWSSTACQQVKDSDIKVGGIYATFSSEACQKTRAETLLTSHGRRSPGKRSSNRLSDIPVSIITNLHSSTVYSPRISRAKHAAFDHCVLSDLKSSSMAKQFARHFQNIHRIFAVSNLLDDEL